MLLDLDSCGLALVNLTKEKDGDRLTHYLEVQEPLMKHEGALLGLDIWSEGGACVAASVGADLGLQVGGSSPTPTCSSRCGALTLQWPTPTGYLTTVCPPPYPVVPRSLAMAGQEGAIKVRQLGGPAPMSQVWYVRAAKPCLTVHRSPASPPSCLSWSGDDMLVVGTGQARCSP